MSTVAITVRISPEHRDNVIAEMAELGCHAFEENTAAVLGYADGTVWNEASRNDLRARLTSLGQPFSLEEDVIQDVNWNEQWEASIHPIDVPPFLIKPSWHPVVPEYAGRIILEIDPKMAFGTGYHPSTRLALRLLSDRVRTGDMVLDAGCGTGILAVAALKLGARRAIGFDIDPWSATNADENARRNGLDGRLEVREGTIDLVPEDGFDLILANINRNVLEDLLPTFAEKRAPGGTIVLAGLLTSDREHMIDQLSKQGFHPEEEASEEDWWAVVAR